MSDLDQAAPTKEQADDSQQPEATEGATANAEDAKAEAAPSPEPEAEATEATAEAEAEPVEAAESEAEPVEAAESEAEPVEDATKAEAAEDARAGERGRGRGGDRAGS